ncbi:pfkB family carbohydrate kinase [Firmicutes bacterium CAG:582]|nr:pfkB family carbohydrate kinase [Firmicutes bacterium CAG:582]
METIIIGKPAVNVYLPLQEFPNEGDVFHINTKYESVGNVGATSSCLLAKYGLKNHFTGVVGSDAYAEKIRNTFKEYRIDTKYMETNYEKGTVVNYMVLNTKNGITTKILYNDPENQLVKYKYDFIPNFAIIDGTDFAGAYALLNNTANCQTLFYARFGDRDTINLSKRCTYVVCTQVFAEMMSKETIDDSQASCINLYQRLVDISGKSNYIIILKNHKILYCVDGKVKLVPEMKMNIVDYSSFDSIFVGALAFALIRNVNLDDAIKFADTAASISIGKVGEVDSIPELMEVLENSGLKEKFGIVESTQKQAIPETIEPIHSSEVENNIVTNHNQQEQNSSAANDVNQSVAFGEMPKQPIQEEKQQTSPEVHETNIFDEYNV